MQGTLPRPGVWELGETGMDFVPDDEKRGREQVLWEDVDSVECDIFRERVRSFDVLTTTGTSVTLVAEDSVGVLRTIAAHVGREKIVDINARAREASSESPLRHLGAWFHGRGAR